MNQPLSPLQFVARWRGNTRKETAAYFDHFNDLCRMVGHPTPNEFRGTEFFGFQADAAKQGGGNGWADVWFARRFAIEYKGPHKKLDAAYDQLLLYRESLQNPPLLVVSDMERIIIHTNWTNTVKRVVELSLDDLLTPAGQQHLHNLFYAPEAFRSDTTSEQVTKQAAAEFARLADSLRRWKNPPDQIAHFLIRLLFCLFAEDVGLLPERIFSRLVAKTQGKTKQFSAALLNWMKFSV